MHNFKGKFDSIISLHTKIIEEFKDQVPDSVTFNVGYYEGQQHAKVVIASVDDLKMMYKKYPSGDISLWCDGRVEDNHSRGRKRRKFMRN